MLARDPGIEVCVPGHGIDDDAIAVQDILSLTDDHVAGKRNGLLFQIVNAEITAGILVLGNDGYAAARFDPADVLLTLRHNAGALQWWVRAIRAPRRRRSNRSAATVSSA